MKLSFQYIKFEECLIKKKIQMRKLFFIIFMLISFVGISQEKQPITKADLLGYLEYQQIDTVGYAFVVKEESAKGSGDAVIIQIFDSKYRSIMKQEVTYLPDNYQMSEGVIWDYLKWRFKTYKDGEELKPFTGYLRAVAITEKIPYPKTLEGFYMYLNKK